MAEREVQGAVSARLDASSLIVLLLLLALLDPCDGLSNRLLATPSLEIAIKSRTRIAGIFRPLMTAASSWRRRTALIVTLDSLGSDVPAECDDGASVLPDDSGGDDADYSSSIDDDEDDDDDDDSSAMGAWVPVGSVSCLTGLGPTQIEIMGRKFVVWEATSSSSPPPGRRQQHQEWSVLVDECPHRLAPLSQGRVSSSSAIIDTKEKRTACIECPYHGWQFDRDGTLLAIPQLEEGAKLRSDLRSVQSFHVHVTGDLLWAFLPTSFHGESFPRSLLPEGYYTGLTDFVKRGVTFYSQDMPFSHDFFVEK